MSVLLYSLSDLFHHTFTVFIDLRRRTFPMSTSLFHPISFLKTI
jgi:hypothetical protein